MPANENIFRVCTVFLPKCRFRPDLTYRYEYAAVNPSLPYGNNPRAYTENVFVRGYINKKETKKKLARTPALMQNCSPARTGFADVLNKIACANYLAVV